MQYRIAKDGRGFWDIVVTHPDGTTVGLNGDEPHVTLEELGWFLDELDADGVIPVAAMQKLRDELAALSPS